MFDRVRREKRAREVANKIPEMLRMAGVRTCPTFDTDDGEIGADLTCEEGIEPERQVMRRDALALMEELPAQTRYVLRLRLLEDRTRKVTAQRLTMTLRQVKQLEDDGLVELRRLWARGRAERKSTPEPVTNQTTEMRREMETRVSRADLIRLRARLEEEMKAKLHDIDCAIRLFDSGLLASLSTTAPRATPSPHAPAVANIDELVTRAVGELPDEFTTPAVAKAVERYCGIEVPCPKVLPLLRWMVKEGRLEQTQGNRGRRPSAFRKVGCRRGIEPRSPESQSGRLTV